MEEATARPWADLVPDLLRQISVRLGDATDLVRFHAVCRAWRDTLTTTSSHSPALLPWLLAPGHHCGVYPTIAQFRSIFSKTTWCAPGTSSRRNKWLPSADGAATWLLTVGHGSYDRSRPRLANPFTGAAATLPPLPAAIENYFALVNGVVCLDGTVCLYAVVGGCNEYWCRVRATILRPGDTAWAQAESHQLMYTGFEFSCAAAYHDGEVVLVDYLQTHIVKLRVTGRAGDGEILTTTRTSREITSDWRVRTQCIYAVESRGELLAFCLRLRQPMRSYNNGRFLAVPRVVSVTVYALDDKGASDGSGVRRWVRRDGRSLADRVLFLGRPTSFAVDAARFGGAVSGGGCAYFVLNSRWVDWSDDDEPEVYRVYRHSFEDARSTVVEELPAVAAWSDEPCRRRFPGLERDSCIRWFVPQPSITPAHEISQRLRHASLYGKQQGAPCPRRIIRLARTGLGPYYKIYVGNLPAWVNTDMLRDFFVDHGAVENTRVVCDTRTERSLGFGFVTMATVCEQEDVIAALDGEIFYGRTTLQVKFGEERPEGPFVMSLRTPAAIE